jgi:hypothetical protein
MKSLFRKWSLTALVGLAVGAAQAQTNQDHTYSLKKLSQEPIKTGKRPEAEGIKESKDTTFTLYKNSSVPMRLYFVNGEQYNPLFNPNPTGIYLGGQHFTFFCDPEKSFRQNSSIFLDIYEFTYLGRQYLSLMTMREDCTKGCNFRCYNLFDLTNPKAITQTSFSSIFQGTESYGDFNMDGRMDVARIIPKTPENLQKHIKVVPGSTYLVTAYAVMNGQLVQLKNDQGSANYIFGKGDPEGNQFSLLQHDWMIPLRDSTGIQAKPVSYYQPYTPFDPKEQFLYDTKGKRVEKSRWTLQVRDFTDLDGAQQFCEELASRKFDYVFIMADQYSRDISFQVMVGNYAAKEHATTDLNKLKGMGIVGKMRDLKAAY